MIAGHGAWSARPSTALAAVGLLVSSAAPLRAQPSTRARVSNLAVNAAIGGVLAGARSVFGGRGLVRPTLLGAAGGALQGAGRQVVSSSFTGSGLAGRQLSALGISLTYSAASDSLILFVPIGPVTFELRPRAEQRLQTRVNLVDVATIVSALADGGTEFDLAASLSSGAPVFSRRLDDMPHGYDQLGFSQVGVIFLAKGYSPEIRRGALRHESVHLLQWDAYNQLVAIPLERAMLRTLTGRPSPTPFVDLGVVGPTVAYVVAWPIRYDLQPWEREAYLLTTGGPAPRLP